MFDVSFSELMVIALVALVVIGPEKLPKVARTLGALTGRMQRYMSQIKEEVEREAHFADLQKLQQEIKQGWDKAEEEFRKQSAEIEQNMLATPVIEEKVAKEPTKQTARKAVTKKVTASKASAKKSTNSTQAAKKTSTKKTLVKKPSTKAKAGT